MNIKQLMQDMHNASNEEEKKVIEEKIKSQFSSLSEPEQKAVKTAFLNGLDSKLKEADDLFDRVDVALVVSEISQYSQKTHKTSLKLA
jgi:hypothetical protein